ncbi:MAG: amidohydrolase family protein [Coriobacteriia bacterium]
MIITADWVIPVSDAPIRRGAVRVHGAQIADVGKADVMCRCYPDLPVHEYPGCVIAPGLVNAHTHLSLTSLAGLMPSDEFSNWLAALRPALLELDQDDYAISAAYGAIECLRSGVTVVGDIAYGPEAPAAAADAGLGGVFFWEVLGHTAGELPEVLASEDFPLAGVTSHGRTSWGISPHSVYTSGPGLIRAVHDLAQRRGLRTAIHVAESPAELRLLTSGTGPLSDVAGRLASDFKPPGVGVVRYLDRLGALKDAIAIHCVQLMPGEAQLLAAKAAGVVLCPRSNSYLHNGRPPVKALRESGAWIAVGTDSHASNSDLDLFAEARALRALDPEMPAERLLAMMTLEAAVVLGVEDLYGALAAGHQADLIVVQVGPTEDPISALIDRGAPERVRTVMAGGVLRILDGRPIDTTTELEKQNARVAEKAARAIERSQIR